MADYQDIRGLRVKYLSADPSNPESGEVWYNSTTGTLKARVSTAAWSAGAPLTTPRTGLSGAGSLTAGAVFGGTPPTTGATEEYNGFGWSNGGTMTTARFDLMGFGTQTAAVAVGGDATPAPTNVEEYNGTSWGAGGAIPAVLAVAASTGILTAGLIAGGSIPPYTQTYEYDGSTWTGGGALNTGRQYFDGAGPQTASVAAGGWVPPNSNATEEYNGTGWTTVNDIGTARRGARMAGVDSGSALLYGGIISTPTTASEEYDGTSWSATPSLATGRREGGRGKSGSTATAAFIAGGDVPPMTTATEEFNRSGSVLTAAAWSASTALPSARWNTSGTGIETASLCFGGSTGPALPSFLNTTFEGDGSSWTAGGVTPISSINMWGSGTQTASIGGGGLASPGANSTAAFTYNGTGWTSIVATPFATKGAGSAGTTTAALIYGSDISPSDNQDSYSWNGVAWSEEGALNSNFQNGASGGPTENTAFAGGSLYSPAPISSTRFETYNGTVWANGPAMGTGQYQNRGFGSSAECLSIGGYNQITTVQRFNGTAWATSPSLAAGRKQFASSNFGASGVTSGWVGSGASFPSGATEKFSEESLADNIKTLTTS